MAKTSKILLAHGSGGRLSHDLVAREFVPPWQNPILDQLNDSAVFHLSSDGSGPRMAFTTDSYVVKPLFFRGGDIGRLAVCGTVNDLAMVGAQPLYLSASFVIEEGLPLSTMRAVVRSMREAAAEAGVQIVTGDTKVVERGAADGLAPFKEATDILKEAGGRRAPPVLQARIKYEGELNRGFAYEVASIPGGEGIFECLQCGTCSGVCPIAPYMDYTPRRLINMVREGFKEEVLHSRTVWLCTSCYSCTVNCPAGIHITDVMYALKRLAIREGTHPRRYPIPALAQEFLKNVGRTGRNNEFRTVLGLALRTNPLRLLKMAPLALRLLRRGRLDIRGQQVRQPRALSELLCSVRETRP